MPQKLDSKSQGRPISIDASVLEASRVMVEAFRLASRSDGATDILHSVLDGLASLVDQDASGVYVIDRNGRQLSHSVFRGCDPEVPGLESPFDGKGIVGDVLASGHPLLITEDSSSETSVGRPSARSRLVVPIVGSDRQVLGAFELLSDEPNGYDDAATQLVLLYGMAVAASIEGARLRAEIVDKRQLDSDMALANQVMEELLPNTTPNVPGFDIAGSHESSHSVGGDYYEFIPLVDDRWGVVIADVVGKGIPAALLVSALRASMSALVGHELAVRAVLRRANRFFHESVEDGKFVTMFYAVIDPPRRRMLYVNAGHTPPILLRANGEVELLEEGGVPLGLFAAPKYFEGHVNLEDGDLLALYTDGIVETADDNEKFYGIERMVEQLKAGQATSATQLCSSIMQAVRRYGGSAKQDDRTLVVMKATSH